MWGIAIIKSSVSFREGRITLLVHPHSEQGVPPYVVFSDKTLVELSAVKPTTRDEMLAVSGICEVKLERYAEPFLRVIGEFMGG